MKLDKRLLQQTGNARRYLVITIGLSVVIGILTVTQAHFMSQIIDGVFLSNLKLEQVSDWLFLLLLAIILRALLVWGSEVAADRAARNVKTNLREKLFSHLFKLGPAYTRSERTGELTNTAGEGIEALDALFSQYLPQIFITVLVPLTILIAVFSADTLSGIVLLVTAPVLPFFMELIGRMAGVLTRKQYKSMSLLSAHFLDVLQGLTTLKLFGRSKLQEKNIANTSESFRRLTMSVLKVAFLSALVLEIGATISTAIVAVEIGLRLVYAQIGFQSALFVLLLAPEFYMPFRALGARFHAGMSGFAAAQRIFEILDKPIASNEAKPTNPYLAFEPNEPLKLEFEQVHYAYNGGERPALQGLSFTIEAGQKIALVGASGGGKSTVAQLLLRFFEPDSGSIRVNGLALGEIKAEEWRKQVAWIPQNPYLFNTSVLENIRLGKQGASLEEVIEAAKLANAHDFIATLPQGYATVIGERGSRLSGGQAQRISLARAFLRNAPLLIMDEATANLDPVQEARIVEATNRLLEGRSALIIAHRLSTVYRADNILVLKEGRVIESGAHHELLAKNGLYRELVGAYRERGDAA
ncbi:MAG: thiol reductant ABC exporter subunit CydD [Chloroflexi bacterium]|uniref:Thiol reductant ABC exporter subunit CydD n=1 Tax=Candidatus Chlorohelix allophototropha TaxID=3003348 RepID=A0A8T7LTJ6_9CHLR|nr:thiol reductant ABC exporter subunit CydD [Chloroflexota bacterium]WJW67230.1 thiol reductant ABC exporter subunit CydD [Chloroflexota bacterium L227-S17]